jgi:hypothetical protein
MPLRVRAPLTAPPRPGGGENVILPTLSFTSTSAITATSAGGAPNVWGDFQPAFGLMEMTRSNRVCGNFDRRRDAF